MLIKFIIVLILNIPVSIMFHKAWLNGKNAFIPFLNVFEYFELVGFKKKYLISVLMIIFSFLLCWNNHKGLGLYAQGMYYGLGDWIVLLYSIPACFVIWWLFWIASLITTFMCLIWAWRYCSLYWEYTPLVFFGTIAMFTFLMFFFAKLAYKAALKFWWWEKMALVHAFFQPLTIWWLGLWSSKYDETERPKQESLIKIKQEYIDIKENKFKSPIAENKLNQLSASDFLSVEERNNLQTQNHPTWVEQQPTPVAQPTPNPLGPGNVAPMPEPQPVPQQVPQVQAQPVQQPQVAQQQPTIAEDPKPKLSKEELEKKHDRFFRRAMALIIGLYIVIHLIIYLPKYKANRIAYNERVEKTNQETSEILEKLLSWDYECDTPDHRPWSKYIETTKLPEGTKWYWESAYLYTWENSDICYWAFDLSYTINRDGKKIDVDKFEIEDFHTKEVLFRCVEEDDVIVELIEKEPLGNKEKGCRDLYDKQRLWSKHGNYPYDENGKLKDYDDFDDPVLSAKLKELNLHITESCDKIFRSKWNTYYDHYYYLSWDNELIYLGQLGHQKDDCWKYNEYIFNAIIGKEVPKLD